MPNATVTVIPRRFGVFFSTGLPLVWGIGDGIGSTPEPPSRNHPFEGSSNASRLEATDRAPARAEARARSSPRVANARASHVSRERDPGRPPGGAVHGPAGGGRRWLGPSEAPRLGGPRRESPRALTGLARAWPRRRDQAAVRPPWRRCRHVRSSPRPRGRRPGRAPRPAPRHEDLHRGASRRGVQGTTPRSTAQSVTAGIDVPVRHEVEEERDVVGEPARPGRSRLRLPAGHRAGDPERRHQEGLRPGPARRASRGSRCARYSRTAQAAPGSRLARSSPRPRRGMARARPSPARPPSSRRASWSTC